MQAIKQFVDFLFERGQNIYELEADILIRQRGPVGGKSQNIYEFEADIFIRQGQRGARGGGESENPKIFMSLKPIF